MAINLVFYQNNYLRIPLWLPYLKRLKQRLRLPALKNLLGQRHVPADAYYGIHTLRAVENFNISNVTISDVPEFVRGMIMTKKAATLANKELGVIPKDVANYILQACDLILETGKCMD